MSEQNATRSQDTRGAGSNVENESALLYYLGVLRRQIWIVLPVILVFGVIGLIISFRTPRVYLATAQLLVERVSPQVMGFERSLEAGSEWDREFYATQTGLVRSRTVMETALHRPDLLKIIEDEMRSGESPGVSFLNDIRRTALSLLGAAPAPPPGPWEVLQQMVMAEHLEGTHFVLVKVMHGQAYRAAFVANSVAKAFRDYHKQRKIEELGEAFLLLQDQKNEAEQDLARAEKALQEFRESARAVSVSPTDGDQPVVDRLVKLNSQLTEVQISRVELASQIAVMRDSYNAEGGLTDASGERLFSLPVIQSDQTLSSFRTGIAEAEKEVAALGQTYGAEHPILKAARAKATLLREQFKSALNDVIEAHANKLKMLETQEQELQKKYEEQKLVALDLAKETFTLTRLQNDVERFRRLYDALVERLKEVDISKGLARTNVQLVEEAAIPATPFGTARKRAFLLALFVGIFLGIGLAFLFENLDDTIKTPEDLKENFDIPFLGFVPSVAQLDETSSGAEAPPARRAWPATAAVLRKAGESLRQRMPGGMTAMSRIQDEPDEERARVGMITLREPVSSVAEAYRNIRANLFYATPENDTKTLSFTSSRPQEGKSTTTCNLALSIAQTGKRVLLIDGDLHRPSVDKLLGLKPSGGLGDALAGRANWKDLLQKVVYEGRTVDNLDVICSGQAAPNPSELLGSDGMKKILDDVKKNYDWVLVDTPPILFVSDAGILSTMCDGVVVVVRSGNSTRSLLTRTTEQLRNLNARILGTVLNNVVISRMGRYYSSYYSYGYSQYAADYRRAYYHEREKAPEVSSEAATGASVKRKKRAAGRPQAAPAPEPAGAEDTLRERVAELEAELKQMRERRRDDLRDRESAARKLAERDKELEVSRARQESLTGRVRELEQVRGSLGKPERKQPAGLRTLKERHWARRRNRRAALTRAGLHISSGDLPAALEILRELTEARPSETRAWEMMIMVLGELGDEQELKVLIDNIKNVSKNAPHIHGLAWGQINLIGNNPAGARNYLEEALSVSPRNVSVIETLVKAMLKEGEAESARKMAGRLLQIDPENAYGNCVMGSCYVRMNKMRRAEKALRKSLRTRTIPEAANNLGWLLMQQGNLMEGEKFVRRALSACRTNAQIWDTLAEILVRGGRFDEARESIEKAVSLDPGNPVLLLHSAELAVKSGESEEARELIALVNEKRGQLSEENRAKLDELSTRARG